MSKQRPHVSPTAQPPPLPDKFKMGELTPQQKAEWLRSQPQETRDLSLEMRERYERIKRATELGWLGWEQDPNHYRDGSPYCKCPSIDGLSGGSVAAHNERFERILRGIQL